MDQRRQSENKWDRLEWLRGDPNGPQPAPLPASGMPPASAAREIPYRPSLGKPLLAMVFFGVCAVIMAHEAQTNDRGVVLNGLVELSTSGATVFYWVICGLSLGLVATALFFGLPQLLIPRRIVLEPDAITIPGWGFSRKHYRIPREEVRGVHLSSYQKIRMLKIIHVGGSKTINSSMMPHDGDMDTVLAWFKEPAPAATHSRGATGSAPNQ